MPRPTTPHNRTRTLKKERSRSITQDTLIHCILLFFILCFILLCFFSRSGYEHKSLAAHSFNFMVSKSPTIKSQKGIDSPSLKKERWRCMPQNETQLYYYRTRYANAAEGSEEKRVAKQELDAEIRRREEIDDKINKIADVVFGFEKRTVALTSGRSAGEAFVDDWECYWSMNRIYEERCGKLTVYGWKYGVLFANMCNDGIKENQLASVAGEICSGRVA